ncbi:flagellar protein FlaG [Pseudodesulfovibrio sp.]|uniref:flagellar protein FlaG n=1 Tax=Pseudodesulfovibrio sp. TaxID=2035812 RepID=UPI00260FEDAE|nr:flagellar protein FlaG [Pseudodesulfovibrio sp.]MDD3313302.1 flagellar protein FlaG [Pseudodesulfovibrio sp.]
MNVPESVIETRQGASSESVFPAKAADRPPGQDRNNRSESDGAGASGAASAKGVSRETVNTLVSEMETRLEQNNVQLKFNILEEDDSVQVEIIDGDGKTIRKIPSDELVNLSKSLKNLDRGFLDEIS